MTKHKIVLLNETYFAETDLLSALESHSGARRAAKTGTEKGEAEARGRGPGAQTAQA